MFNNPGCQTFGDFFELFSIEAECMDGHYVMALDSGGYTRKAKTAFVAFLKALTSPSARQLKGVAPDAVPSGLPMVAP